MPTSDLALLPTLLFGVAGLGVPGCGSGDDGAPLHVREPRADFGVVSEGQVMEHAWEVAVRAPLSVREATTDCGCTLARLELQREGRTQPYELGSALVPGDRLLLNARYDTLGRRGPSTRAVTLVHSGGQLALALTADVRPWLQVDPPALAFTRVREGQPAEASFQVAALSGDPFGLGATRRALPPWVSLTLTPATGEARSPAWSVVATLGADAPRGIYSYSLELETDVVIPGQAPAAADGAPLRHYALSPVWSLQVVGPVALSRASLEFGQVDGRETSSQSLRLQSFDPAYRISAVKARLVPVSSGDPFPLGRTARVVVHPGAEASDIEVVLAGLDPEVSGTFMARLVVETGHPGLPELEALVRGTRRPAEGRP